MPWKKLPAFRLTRSSDHAGTAVAAHDAFPYALPLFAYLAGSALEGLLPRAENHPSPVWYPLAYAIKVMIVGILAWACRSTWKDLRPDPSLGALSLALAVGLLVWGLWIGLDGLYPKIPLLGERQAFDPRALPPVARGCFFAVRMLGLVILVPLIEELFWRSFLIRWVLDPEFEKVPVGRVTPVAAGVTSLCFAAVHPEWLPALLTGLLWALLLVRTKSLGACVASHSTANLALGIYVMVAGAWKYW